MAEVFPAVTGGNAVTSFGDHTACDTAITVLRACVEQAEAKLAAIRTLCHDERAPFAFAADILAIIGGEEKSQADAVPPPSLAAIRVYLGVRGWNEEEPTLAGVLWNLHGAVKVAVPLEDGHPDLMRAIVARIARAEGRTQGETAAAIHAAWTARNERPETGSEEGSDD